jgi:CBS domain-containing protein
MSIIDDFLSKYTEVESFIRSRNKTDNNAKFDILDDKVIRKNSEIWKFYKSLRNLLTHQNDARNGKFINLTDDLYQAFALEAKRVMRPQKAIDIAIPSSKIYKITKNENVNTVIQTMLDENYTCAPIVNGKGIIEGVFSSHSLMLYFNQDKPDIADDTKNLKIADLGEFCDLYNDPDIEYRFVKKDITVDEVSEMFKENFDKERRLEVVFITENGKPTEKILALLTHWDFNKRAD